MAQDTKTTSLSISAAANRQTACAWNLISQGEEEDVVRGPDCNRPTVVVIIDPACHCTCCHTRHPTAWGSAAAPDPCCTLDLPADKVLLSLITASAPLLVKVAVVVFLLSVVAALFVIALSPVASKDTHSLPNSIIALQPGTGTDGVETKEQKLSGQIRKMCKKIPDLFDVKQINAYMGCRPNPEALKTVLYQETKRYNVIWALCWKRK